MVNFILYYTTIKNNFFKKVGYLEIRFSNRFFSWNFTHKIQVEQNYSKSFHFFGMNFIQRQAKDNV